MGQHRTPKEPRTRRALRAKIREQQAYIDLCDGTIARLCNENDRLKIKTGEMKAGPLDDTVIMPVVTELTPPTHTIPIVLPNGTVLRTEPGPRRPSWARSD